MSVRIVSGEYTTHGGTFAVMYDSVTMWAFGPVFRGSDIHAAAAEDVADAFMDWAGEREDRDLREIPQSQIEGLYSAFMDEYSNQPQKG